MAYTIISQNNTTTTLADENGNVITVPARVTLATSTDYTIKKVNNNSVDLEDGDGKIIRGVPACVVLAGEGGGSGGSVSSVNGQTGDVVLDALDVGAVAKTGDTMSGVLNINVEPSSQYHYASVLVLKATYNGSGEPVTIGVNPSGYLYIDNPVQLGANLVPNGTGKRLGSSIYPWSVVYTTAISNGADIAVPTTGGTMAVIGVNTTATLAVADWSSNTQTVSVSGVKADSVVFVSPAPASASDYASAGILCTAQAANSLTFTATTTPSVAITVNVICM